MTTIDKREPYILRKGQEEMIEHINYAFKFQKIALMEAPTGTGKTYAALETILPFHNKKKLFWTSRDVRTYKTPIREIIKLKKRYLTAQFIGKKDFCLNNIINVSKDFHEDCQHAVRYKECSFYSNTIEKYDPEEKNVVITDEAKKFSDKMIRQIKNNNWDYLNYNYNLAEYVKDQCAKTYCPYEIMRLIVSEANIVFFDYWHILFNPMRDQWLEKIKSELKDIILVIDEADNLIERLIDNISKEISDFSLAKLLNMTEKEIVKQTKEIRRLSNMPSRKVLDLKSETEKILEAWIKAQNDVKKVIEKINKLVKKILSEKKREINDNKRIY